MTSPSSSPDPPPAPDPSSESWDALGPLPAPTPYAPAPDPSAPSAQQVWEGPTLGVAQPNPYLMPPHPYLGGPGPVAGPAPRLRAPFPWGPLVGIAVGALSAGLGLSVAVESPWAPAIGAVVLVGVILIPSALLARRHRHRAEAVRRVTGDSLAVWARPVATAASGPQPGPTAVSGRAAVLSAGEDRLTITPFGRSAEQPIVLPWAAVPTATWAPTTVGYGVFVVLRIATMDGRRLDFAVPTRGQREAVSRLGDLLARRFPGRTAATTPGWDRWLVPVAAAVTALLALAPGYAASAVPSPGPVLADPAQGAGPASGPADRSYHILGGPGGVAIDPGSPWGTPCTSVILVPAPGSDDHLVQLIHTVADEAARGGLHVVATDTHGGFSPDALTGQQHKIVQIGIFPITTEPPKKPNGDPYRYVAGYDVAGGPGNTDVLSAMSLDLYLKGLGGDDALTRKAIRGLIAQSSGVAVDSTAPGTGISPHLEDSADGFSQRDLDVLMRASGCAGGSSAT